MPIVLQPHAASSGAASRCRRWPNNQVRSSRPLGHLPARTCLVLRRFPNPGTQGEHDERWGKPGTSLERNSQGRAYRNPDRQHQSQFDRQANRFHNTVIARHPYRCENCPPENVSRLLLERACVTRTGNNSNQAQNALTTFGTLEAIDNWLFLDFSGQISSTDH